MSKARPIITAVVVEGRSRAEVARAYGVSKGWVSKLLARWRAEGEAAFEPRSRRPKTSPTALDTETVELIVWLRKQLSEQGLDAGADTIAWHLAHQHELCVSRATVARYLTKAGLVRPKATPGDRTDDTHDRVRRDRIDTTGKITLRHAGRLHSIGIGRTHAGTHVLVLVQDLDIRIIDAATGALLRELVLDPSKRYQGTGRPPGPTRRNS